MTWIDLSAQESSRKVPRYPRKCLQSLCELRMGKETLESRSRGVMVEVTGDEPPTFSLSPSCGWSEGCVREVGSGESGRVEAWEEAREAGVVYLSSGGQHWQSRVEARGERVLTWELSRIRFIARRW
jgi:hypothetical protein